MSILLHNIFEASLLGSIGIILIIILKRSLFENYTQTFNYYIWIFIIIRMSIPFKIPVYMREKVYQENYSTNIKVTSNTITNNGSLFVFHRHNDDLTTFRFLGYVWLIGFLIFLSYNIFIYLNFRIKLKYLTYDISENNITEIYSKLIREMNINKKIQLKVCESISTPLGTGILKPCILLPKATYRSEEIEWILKHELMHYKKHDLIYKNLVMITVAIHWFNPLAYIMKEIINSDCELSCDEAILKNSNMEDRKSYATILVDSLKSNKNKALQSNLSTGLNNNKNNLKRRLMLMLNSKARKKGIAVAALTALIATSSFVSIRTFAQNNNDKAIYKNTSAVSEINDKDNKGNIIDAHSAKVKVLGVNSNDKQMYIGPYKDAPESLKKQFEDYCKKTNSTFDSETIISMPIN